MGWHIDGVWAFPMMGLLGGLLWLVLIVLVVILIWRLVSGTARPGRMPGPPESPPASAAEEVLRHRFASGEIDEEEYRRRLSILRGG